jgi:hypothetical protein
MVAQPDRADMPRGTRTIYCPIRRALYRAGITPTLSRPRHHHPANLAPDSRAVSPAQGRAP